jgi:hypothetical protein
VDQQIKAIILAMGDALAARHNAKSSGAAALPAQVINRRLLVTPLSCPETMTV